MKKYKAGLFLSLAALILSAANLVIRMIAKVSSGFGVQLICLTAVIFCVCLVGYVTKKKK